MPKVTQTKKIIICFILILVYKAKTLADPKTPISNENKIYEDSLYIFVYIFLWNFLIEISLIIIFHFKQSKDYKENHLFINLSIIVIQIMNNIFLIKSKNLSIFENYIQIEIILTFFEMIQIIFGFNLKKKLFSENILPDLFFLKFTHKILGSIIYLGRKYQLFIYLYYYLLKSNIFIPLIIISFLIIITVTTHIFVFLLLEKTGYDLEKKEEFFIHDKKNGFFYKQLLRKIENFEYIPKSSNLRISLMDKNTKENLKNNEKIEKWIIIEDFVYSLKNFSHPLGNFIFEGIQGKDITREFYGLKDFRFSNKKKKVKKNLLYKHSDRTMFYLNKNCIGEINPESYIENYLQNNSDTVSTESLKMFQSKNTYKSKKDIKSYHWSVDTSYNFSKENSLFFIKKCEKDNYINLSCYWLNFFGKYFLLENTKKKTYMYPILSLSPIYIQKKLDWLSSLKINFKNNLLKNQNSDLKEIGNMYLVLQQQLDSQQRQLTESTENEIKTCYLPLLTKNSSNFSPLNEGQKFKLKGPLGFGLNILPNCTEKYLFVIKNEGIYPFIDFLEFLGQKSLIELKKTELEHPIFTQEYLYSFTNHPEFYFFFEISENFKPIAETCGIFQFEQIELAYKNDLKNDVNKIVKNIKICSNKVNLKGGVRDYSNEVAEDFKGVMRIMENINDLNFERIFFSGDEEFVNRVVKNCDKNEECLVFL